MNTPSAPRFLGSKLADLPNGEIGRLLSALMRRPDSFTDDDATVIVAEAVARLTTDG